MVTTDTSENLEQKVNQIINDNMEEWFKTIVIPEAKRMSEAMNLPEKFTSAIQYRQLGKGKGQVVNNFGSPDVPLAIFFNYGTKRNYVIEPKVKHAKIRPRAPRDTEKVGDNSVVHPEALHWIAPTGEHVFRKRVIHPGFPKTLAMQFGVEQGKNRLIQLLPSLIEDKM